MPRYVALLRGINVGGHRVKMAQLRELFVALDLDDVSTFIASGNVIFEVSARVSRVRLERTIEVHLERELGYAVATFLRTPAELDAVGSCPAYPSAEVAAPEHSFYVLFVREPATKVVQSAFAALDSERDTFRSDGREIYWRTRGTMSESPLFASALARATRNLPHTIRNLTTVRKLAAVGLRS
jgi:uncharacterized protein (DUF1697 family)